MEHDGGEPSRRRFLKLGASVPFGLTPAALFGLEARASTGARGGHPDDDIWRRRLGPEAYATLREGVMEFPYSSPLHDEARRGIYGCGGCGRPLFSSTAKYESGTGWPSFASALAGAFSQFGGWKPVPDAALLCPQCEGHLGYVFNDGPGADGRRFCLNGAALRFDHKSDAIFSAV